MDKIRLGIIGCGGMAGTHAQGILKCTNEVEITAVCDVVEERATKTAEAVAELGKMPCVTTDYRTMVDLVDAVLVILPHDLHYECGMFFADHKKHILMEKPLCNTEEECISLIEKCEQENVVLMCAYPVRFYPGILKLKEMVDSGDFGKIIQMSVWTEQLTPANWDHWTGTARIGGGQLFSHGCHYIDVMLWFLGNPVTGTHVGTRVGTPWLLKEGTSAVVMKFENGAVGYHGGTWGARGTRMGYDFQIQTEKGMIEYDRSHKEIRVYSDSLEHIPGEEHSDQKMKVVWTEDVTSKNTQFELLHFVDCIKTGKKPITDGWSSLQSLRVIWKLYDAELHNTMADLRGLGLDNVDHNPMSYT